MAKTRDVGGSDAKLPIFVIWAATSSSFWINKHGKLKVSLATFSWQFLLQFETKRANDSFDSVVGGHVACLYCWLSADDWPSLQSKY